MSNKSTIAGLALALAVLTHIPLAQASDNTAAPTSSEQKNPCSPKKEVANPCGPAKKKAVNPCGPTNPCGPRKRKSAE